MTHLEVVVLGSAQDGGVPQLGCSCANCRAARAGGRGRYAASLAVLVRSGDGGGSPALLVDAGPDLRRQWDLLPVPDAVLAGVMLTHLHMGHLAGLLELGPEVLSARGVPVYCTRAVALFLRTNAPWSLLAGRGHIQLREFSPGQPVRPLSGLTVRAFEVPHRNEFADTVGYILTAGETGRGVLYIPDADRWEGLRPDLLALVGGVRTALLDGTFYSRQELAAVRGRDIADVPHPTIEETLALLGSRARKVLFTHLNHTNPVLDDASAQAGIVRAAGAGIARDGLAIPLGPQEADEE